MSVCKDGNGYCFGRKKKGERGSREKVGFFFLLSGSERVGGGGIGLLASVVLISFTLVFLIFFLTKIREFRILICAMIFFLIV